MLSHSRCISFVLSRIPEKADPEEYKHPKEEVSSVLIVILPRNTIVSQAKIGEELEKFGKVEKVRIWSALDPLLALAEFKNEEMARKMVSATNGKITVDGQKWTICTVKECEEKLKIVEGPSPLRMARRPPAVNIDSLWGIYRNYLDSIMTDESEDCHFGENVSLKSTATARPIVEYSWIDNDEPRSNDEDTDSEASFRSAPQSITTGYGSSRSASTSVCWYQTFVPCTGSLRCETPPPAPPTFTWRPNPEYSGTPWITVDPLQSSLPPPYHNLPDTPFFKNAKIVPPPLFDNEGLPTLQRITNRYLASMKIQDELDIITFEQLGDHERTKLFTGFNYLPPKTKHIPSQRMAESELKTKKKSSLWSEMEIVRQKNEVSWSPWKSSRLFEKFSLEDESS